MLDKDNHSSLLQKFVAYSLKKLFNIGPWCDWYKEYKSLFVEIYHSPSLLNPGACAQNILQSYLILFRNKLQCSSLAVLFALV